MSGVVRVKSDVMGTWHHPRKGARGRFVGRTDYDVLLGNESFKLWYDTYRGRSSRTMAKLTVWRLLKAGGLSDPDEFLALSVPKAKRLIRKVVNQIEARGDTQAARHTQIFSKVFYNFHNEDLGKFLRFKRNERPKPVMKKIRIEIIPNRLQVYRMASTAFGMAYTRHVMNKFLGYRNRALILSLWQSGVRVNALCRLTYGMVKAYLYPTVKAPIPLKITQDIDTKLSSYGLGYYYTFLADSAAQAIREYLDVRTEITGQPLRDEDYLFVVLNRRNKISDRPMRDGSVLHEVKVVAGRAGLKHMGIWSHVLRKAFRKVLNGCIHMDEDTREALMGHKLPGSRGNYFDVHDIREIAEKYIKADWTEGAPSRLEGLEKTVTVQEDQIKKLERRIREMEEKKEKSKRVASDEHALGNITPEAFKHIIESMARAKTMEEAIEKFRRLQENPRPKENNVKIVEGEEALVAHMKQGWTLVKELNHDKYLLKST